MKRATQWCHEILQKSVSPGDTVVDATAGNGNDTLFLAELVGAGGTVWAFDIQEEALGRTSARLSATGAAAQVRFFAECHTRIPERVGRGIAAAVFNLGFLPGGDKSLVTRSETTVEAVRRTIALLRPGGVVVVVVYPGHPGGREEAEAVVSLGGEVVARDPARDNAPYCVVFRRP